MIKIIQQKTKEVCADEEGEILYADLESVEDLEKRVEDFCINHTIDIVNVIAAGKDNLITFIIESGSHRRV